VVESTRIALTAVFCAWIAAAPAAAQAPRLESETYPVSGFDIEYALDAPGQPDPAELLATEVELRVGTAGLLPPHPMAENVRFRLDAVPPGSRFHAGALRQVNRVLLAEFTRRDIGGVLVTMPDLDERTGIDQRAAGDTRVRVRIWTGRVEGVSTLADGERFAGESLADRSNRPEHAWIREGSPVTAGGERALLRPTEVEEYAAQLSRQPGRRVSPVLRPGELDGATRLEYHVAEHKPWLVYAQASNTGTEATSDWRERFGFSHTQLTGRDDVLRFDYVTDFDSVHAVWGEYGGPIWRVPRLRWSVDGSWNDYDSSEVGISEVDFNGSEWSVGGRLDANVLQFGDLFVDLFAATHWNRIHVDNSIVAEAGSNFLLPAGGVAAEHVGEVWSLGAELGFTGNIADLADTDTGGSLDALGRTDADRDFAMMTWNAETAMYPLTLLRRASWREESELGAYDFVQELAFQTLGQFTFDDKRLVPQLQQVAGGLYTVRGYEQSVTAGDTVAIVRAEYRLHLPRLLEPSAAAPVVPLLGTFRVRPENAYSFPDWDLIARAFVDAAHVVQYKSDVRVCTGDDPPVCTQTNEPNETIWALGFGGELRLSRYFSASLDVAYPQRRLERNDPELDKPRLHAVITVLY
jgi:hypothetical protein